MCSSFLHFGQSLLKKLQENDLDVRAGVGGRFKIEKSVALGPQPALLLRHGPLLVDLGGCGRREAASGRLEGGDEARVSEMSF